MLKFNEEEIRKDIQNVLACRPEVEKVVDSICSDGYENLILLEHMPLQWSWKATCGDILLFRYTWKMQPIYLH